MWPQKPFLTVADFCELIGISRAAVYNLWKTENGPPRVMLGGSVLIPTDRAKVWAEKLIEQQFTNPIPLPIRGNREKLKTIKE